LGGGGKKGIDTRGGGKRILKNLAVTRSLMARGRFKKRERRGGKRVLKKHGEGRHENDTKMD